jgi:3-oxoacyl-(acyl-carrier-protein) synthase
MTDLRAAVVGWACRTPLGATVDDVVRRLLAGERAAQANPRFDARTYACPVAAAIATEPAPSRHRRFLRRLGLHALEVASEALADSTGGARRPAAGDRLGLFFGYGGLRAHWNDMMPAFEHQDADGSGRDGWERGFKLFHPFWMLQHLSNNAHALAAETLGAKGEGATFGGANAGAQALASAIRALAVGAVDDALVVAHDTLIEPETLVELAARGAATGRTVDALTAPYDRDADGFVPGEAAVALMLTRPTPNNGSQRSVVQAEDGADGGSGEPAPATVRRVAARLARQGDVIDGAGVGRPVADGAERAGLAELVGAEALLTCTLAATGQVGAGAPVLQAIIHSVLLSRGMVAPIAGLHEAGPGPLQPVRVASETRARSALAISTGAPGLMAAVRVEVS